MLKTLLAFAWLEGCSCEWTYEKALIAHAIVNATYCPKNQRTELLAANYKEGAAAGFIPT